MAKEAIDLIKKAEDDARNILGDSQVKAAELIRQAQISDKKKLEDLTAGLKTEYTEAINASYKKASEKSLENQKAAENEAEQLKKELFSKKDKAIKKVIEKILES